MGYKDQEIADLKQALKRQESDLEKIRRRNNPNNEPTGHYTGRCGTCGSNNLWDDNLSYGCNNCGGIWIGG